MSQEKIINVNDNSYSSLINYIKYFKKVNIDHPNKYISKINDFIFEFLNDDGYLLVNKEFVNNLIDLILYILEKEINKEKIAILINANKNLFFTSTEKNFYKIYFEDLINIFLLSISKNLFFNKISNALCFIYYYGTTINNFDLYLKNNAYLINLMEDEKYVDKTKSYEKIINEYSKNIKYDHYQTTPYILLTLGHLFTKFYKIKIDDKKTEKIILENPFNMFLRISIQLSFNLDETYYTLETIFTSFYEKYLIPSTPMFFNSLRKEPLMTSCFILNIEDNIDSIASVLEKCLKIQQHNSGIGINLGNLRSVGSIVKNGLNVTKGIDNFISIFANFTDIFSNNIRHRSSNTNLNLPIEHPEVLSAISLKQNNNRDGKVTYNNLFFTVSIPDEFIYRFLKNEDWYFISPNESLPGEKYLHEVYGEEYSILYNKMINDPNITKTSKPAREVFNAIVSNLIETGSPFIFFKDNVNYTSNHKEFGTLKATNLCTEILEYSSDDETACCNIMSLNLKKFVEDGVFNFLKFKEIIELGVFLLNNTIDITLYSHESCKKSNFNKRPIALGIQGLINACYRLDINDIKERKEFYRNISEKMYYYSLKQSNFLAQNNVFEKYKFKDNYLAENKFSFEHFKKLNQMKKEKLKNLKISSEFKNEISIEILLNNLNERIDPEYISEVYWNDLKDKINKYGLCNSLLLGFMPTSLSATINNNFESFELPINNIYRKLFSNTDQIIYNEDFINDILKFSNYDETNIIKVLSLYKGDINCLDLDPEVKKKLLKKYYQIYDIDQNDYIDFSACNNPFIDQGKSTNLYVKENNRDGIVSSILNYWLKNNKTIYYYITHVINDTLTLQNLRQSINKIENEEKEIKKEKEIEKEKEIKTDESSNLLCVKNNGCISCN